MGFPSSLATLQTFGFASNNLAPRLITPLGAADVSANLSQSVPAYTIFRVDDELIITTSAGVSPSILRPLDSTVAAAHAQNTIAYANVAAYHHNQLANEIISIENALGVNLSNINSIVLASFYNFTAQTPASNLTAGITNTITLTPVPPGVNAADANHYLRITDNTNPESVLITGGTAVAGAATGTITFVPAYSHTSGNWTISSDSGGIREAIISLAAGGGVVQLNPNTTYLIGKELRLDKAVTIYGAGQTSVIKARDGALLDTITLSTVSRTWFYNLKIDGNRSNNGTTELNGTGISFGLYGLGGGSYGGVVGCEITACQKIGISISDTNTNISIYNNYIHHNGGVISSNGNGYGILVTYIGTNVRATNTKIIANHIESNYNTIAGPSDSAGILASTTNSYVAYNYLKNNYNVSGGQMSVSGVIVGNIIVRTGSFGGDLTCGIECAEGPLVITDNVIDGHSTSGGIVLEGNPAGPGGLGAYDATINNNYILTAAIGISLIDAGGYVRGVSISGNRIASGSGHTGISVDINTADVVIVGNNLQDCTTPITDNSNSGVLATGNFPMNEGNLIYKGIVASATTINLTGYKSATISGTAAIQTITLKSSVQAGYRITLIPTGAFTGILGGNIGKVFTAVVGKALDLTYDGTNFYPSY